MSETKTSATHTGCVETHYINRVTGNRGTAVRHEVSFHTHCGCDNQLLVENKVEQRS